jgi:hypothetical protein
MRERKWEEDLVVPDTNARPFVIGLCMDEDLEEEWKEVMARDADIGKHRKNQNLK